MDVHEMLAVVVSDSTSRRSCDLDRKQAEPPASALSPFASAARHSLDMGSTGASSGSSPVAIPRGSLDLPKTSGGGGAAGTYSLSRMLSGSIFPGSLSLSRTSTSTYPSRGSSSPPLSPASTFGGRATPLAPEYSHGWAMDKDRAGLPAPAAVALAETAQDVKPSAAHPKPALGGGLARCLADLNHLEPMFHMDHMDVETFDRHST